MKKILAILSLAAVTTLCNAQGNIYFYSFSGMQTNTAKSSFIGGTESGGAGGVTMSAAGSYYYTLLLSSTDPGSTDPLTAGWTQAIYSNTTSTVTSPFSGNNYPGIAGAFEGPNGTASTTIANWGAGVSDYFMVVGWSANLGSDWATVSAELAGDSWVTQGYFGVSSEGHLASGLGGTSPATSLIGGGPGQVGVFTLYAVPEPTTLALAGLGGMALLAFRRKSRKS